MGEIRTCLADLDKCGIIQLPRHFDPDGSLTEVENNGEFPFEVQRVFYLYDVPANSERGGHSHIQGQELIVAVSGSFDVTLYDGHSKRTFTLDRPYKALYITNGVWRTLERFSAGSVCLVLTSEKYSESDYIRDYYKFLEINGAKPIITPKHRYPLLDVKACDSPYLSEIKDVVNKSIEGAGATVDDEVSEAESALRLFVGTPHAIGVRSGADALHLILQGYKALGRIHEGDSLIVPTYAPQSVVGIILSEGFKPELVAPDFSTMVMQADKLSAALASGARVMLLVHLFGHACWDDALADTAIRNNLLVIEVPYESLGASSAVAGLFGGHNVGALGQASAFDFGQPGLVGSLGSAGAITTHDDALAAVIKKIIANKVYDSYAPCSQAVDPLQAAMMRVKLRHLDEEIDLRRAVAQVYDAEINNPLVAKLFAYEPETDVWQRYVVRVADPKGFCNYLAAHSVESEVVPGLYDCPQAAPGDAATRLSDGFVSLPINRSISVNDAKEIARIIDGYTVR